MRKHLGSLVLASAALSMANGHPAKKYTTTWFDMFRIENGKIAEHWDPAVRQ